MTKDQLRVCIQRALGKTGRLVVRGLLVAAGLATFGSAGASRPGGSPDQGSEHELLGIVQPPHPKGGLLVRIESEYGRKEYNCHLGEQFAAGKPVLFVPQPLARQVFSPGQRVLVKVDHAWRAIGIDAAPEASQKHR